MTDEEKNERLQEAHNQGQADAAKYAGYNRPHNWSDTHLDPNREIWKAENEAYRDGWRNAKDQRDK